MAKDWVEIWEVPVSSPSKGSKKIMYKIIQKKERKPGATMGTLLRLGAYLGRSGSKLEQSGGTLGPEQEHTWVGVGVEAPFSFKISLGLKHLQTI